MDGITNEKHTMSAVRVRACVCVNSDHAYRKWNPPLSVFGFKGYEKEEAWGEG